MRISYIPIGMAEKNSKLYSFDYIYCEIHQHLNGTVVL